MYNKLESASYSLARFASPLSSEDPTLFFGFGSGVVLLERRRGDRRQWGGGGEGRGEGQSSEGIADADVEAVRSPKRGGSGGADVEFCTVPWSCGVAGTKWIGGGGATSRGGGGRA